MQPLKMVTMMAKDNKKLSMMVTTVESVVDDVFILMALFDKYDGGDFCTGLVFGKNGAKLLTQVAQAGFEWLINSKKSDLSSGASFADSESEDAEDDKVPARTKTS